MRHCQYNDLLIIIHLPILIISIFKPPSISADSTKSSSQRFKEGALVGQDGISGRCIVSDMGKFEQGLNHYCKGESYIGEERLWQYKKGIIRGLCRGELGLGEVCRL